MDITKQDVEKIAKLARLEMNEAEKEAFSRQLSTILSYVRQIENLDTAGVEPTTTVLDQVNVFRPDKSRAGLPQEQALANAPASEQGHFQVPRILEER